MLDVIGRYFQLKATLKLQQLLILVNVILRKRITLKAQRGYAMSQLVDNHSLSQDFPEFKETIHDLKINDAHFAKLITEYEALDKEIIRIEQKIEFRSDEEFENLKMSRVHLKDTLYARLQKHK